ncbi:WhiB family transcriptional regulator, partial [Streptomyces cellulosae]
MQLEAHAPSVPPSDTIPKPGSTEDPTLTPLTALTALDDAIENLGVPVPCRSYDPEVFFAESPADVEYAKSLCRTCPLVEACLAGAKELLAHFPDIDPWTHGLRAVVVVRAELIRDT